MSIPTFSITVDHGGSRGAPTSVNIWPVRSPSIGHSDLNVKRALATEIKNAIYRSLQSWNYRFTREVVNRHVRGVLVAENTRRGDQYTNNTIGRNTRGQEVGHVRDIDSDMIDSFIFRIQQSNTQLEIYDLRWSFHFVPSSLRLGACPNVQKPTWVSPSDFAVTWRGHKRFVGEGYVNCAAFSLNWLMNYKKKQYSVKKMDLAVKDAEKLQKKMEWGEHVSVLDLMQFTQKYTDYRIVVIQYGQPRAQDIINGPDFDSSCFQEEKQTYEKCLYLVYDSHQGHYGGTMNPVYIWRKNFNMNYSWCHVCCEAFDKLGGHECSERSKKRHRKELEKCPCGRLGTKTHKCHYLQCKTCSLNYKKDTFHTCHVKFKNLKDSLFVGMEDKGVRVPANGKQYALWGFDIESRMERFEDSTTPKYDIIDGQIVETFDYDLKHVCNMVICINAYTLEKKVFIGEDADTQFVSFMLQYNEGKNIAMALNASGYDSRMLFQALCRINKDVVCLPRGTKFLQIRCGDFYIRDQMLFTPGSLANLGKAYCTDTKMKKGYFPHLFNCLENYSYVGKIPDRRFFNLPFTIRDQKQLDAFNEWYSEWNGREDWNFMKELEDYCENDVLILCEIMRKFNKDLTNAFVHKDDDPRVSPFMFPTLASFNNDRVVKSVYDMAEIPIKGGMDDDEFNTIREQIIEKRGWPILNMYEYVLARKALRGGLTNVYSMKNVLTKEEIEDGVRYVYIDVVSLYPYVQLAYDYPIGKPTIYIWDPDYFYCTRHPNNPKGKCDCVRAYRITENDKRSNVKNMVGKALPSVDMMLNDEFFGIVTVTVECPKDLYFPVFTLFDEEKNKSIQSLLDDKHVEITVTTEELKEAIRCGYRVVHIHRYDKYIRGESPYLKDLTKLICLKIAYSRNQPSEEELEEIIQAYEERLPNCDFRKHLSTIKWEKDSAKKQTSKIAANCIWGKGAQRPDREEMTVLSYNENECEVDELFENAMNGTLMITGVQPFNGKTIFKSKTTREVAYDLSSTYLPPSVFVPAYGRLYLQRMMRKIGMDKVIYCDTDSIVFKHVPGEFCPEMDLILGGWEGEHTDLVEFWALGPKSYIYKHADGTVGKPKLKGVSLYLNTAELINYESLTRVVDEFLIGNEYVIKAPQQPFVYDYSRGMRTVQMLKDVRIKKEELKGELVGARIYPFGFNINT